MSHAMFPGIVLVWIIGMPLGIGAFIVGLSCAIVDLPLYFQTPVIT